MINIYKDNEKPAKKKTLKAKKCAVCRELFQPFQSLQKVCSPKCASDYARGQRTKAERRELKKRKQALKTNGELLKEAQREFNRYIRLRDHADSCIDCGSHGKDENWITGGKWDAGHYLSVGSHPELRFEEDNCHKQLKTCNSGSGKYGKFHSKEKTISQQYRERLIKKIGLKRVEWLEGPHEPKRYKRDEIIEIKKTYAKKARELERRLAEL